MLLFLRAVQRTTDRLDDDLDGRESEVLEGLGVRCGDVGTGDTLDRGIEVVERLGLDNLRADLGSDTEHGETALDRHEAVEGLASVI